MKTNQEYKNAALAALKGNWKQAVLITFVMFAIAVVPSLLGESESTFAAILSIALSVCVLMPLSVGIYAAFRRLYNEGHPEIAKNTFNAAFENWAHNVGGVLLMAVYIFLWTLLLIIPGLIKSFSYSLTPLILNERPELSANEAIDLSMKMMDGHKLDLLILYLSFIGWYLLAFLTLFIGMLWVAPYQYTTFVAFYEDVKAEYESRQAVA